MTAFVIVFFVIVFFVIVLVSFVARTVIVFTHDLTSPTKRLVPSFNLCEGRHRDFFDLFDLIDRKADTAGVHRPADVFFTPASVSLGRVPFDQRAIDVEDLFVG